MTAGGSPSANSTFPARSAWISWAGRSTGRSTASSRRTCPASGPAAGPSSGPGHARPTPPRSPIVHGFSTLRRHGGTGTPASAACSARLTATSSGQRGETPDQSAGVPAHPPARPAQPERHPVPGRARTGRGTRKPGPVSASYTSANQRPACTESTGLSTTCPARQAVPCPPGSRAGVGAGQPERGEHFLGQPRAFRVGHQATITTFGRAANWFYRRGSCSSNPRHCPASAGA